MVNADPDRLAQIASNLLNNAAKYSDVGSKIVVRARRRDDTARIEVIDQGVGIDSAMIGRVFDMFYQDAQTIDRSRGGLGLGLAIVKSLVELHGGRVDVRSEGVGQGSEFSIELPALRSDGQATTPPKAEALRATGNGARVLVVDDNIDGAEMLMAALETLGYAVALAHDGAQALDVAKRFEPDIALLDIGLPVMSGYELASRLRAMKADLHLVALTGYGQEEDRRRSTAAGFDVHLVKPVDLGKLQRDLEVLRSKL
jgi:CheY-like chemotaxis protein/anti-sigma regulatory factor (Ser/Thr protein kinase)